MSSETTSLSVKRVRFDGRMADKYTVPSLRNPRRRIIVLLGVLAAAGGGLAYAAPGDVPESTAFSKAAEFAGFGVNYSTTGASQVRGDRGGVSGFDCSAINTASSSAALTVPAGASPIRAMLYWVGLERNDLRGYTTATPVDPTVRLMRSNGSSTVVTGGRRMVAAGTTNGRPIMYAAYEADVTSMIGASMSDTYTVAITGGIPGLCSEAGENARGWQLVVVYDVPSPDYSIVYIYDGLEYLQNQTRSITISGFDGRSDLPSTLTAFVVQGDSTIPGEYATTSDPSFPDFPVNFAHESVNGSAVSANGHAIDIATLTGSLTAGTRSMTLDFGTRGDIIVPTTFILKLASNPLVPPTTTTSPAPTTTSTLPPTTAATTTTTSTAAPTTAVATTTTSMAATTVASTSTTLVVAPTTTLAAEPIPRPPT